MKITYDPEADAMYIRLADATERGAGGQRVIESEEVKPGVLLDFDADGKLVGIEILDVRAVVGPRVELPAAAE